MDPANERKLIFRVHALQRMFERGVMPDVVRYIVNNGEPIAEYPDDKPYPSRLMLAWVADRPLHVVAADGPQGIIVITVYEPNATLWDSDFRRKLR